jgi:hypothetical protein
MTTRGLGFAVTGLFVLGVAAASGCAQGQQSAQGPGAAVPTRVVVHQGGQYELRGDGTTSAPYYWVWVPSGGTALAQPPTLPAIPPVVTTTERVRRYPEGRYQLVGEGTATAPYYWVWVPGDVTVPPPPALPRRTQGP